MLRPEWKFRTAVHNTRCEPAPPHATATFRVEQTHLRLLGLEKPWYRPSHLSSAPISPIFPKSYDSLTIQRKGLSMMHSRCWIFGAAALCLLPTAAWAQPATPGRARTPRAEAPRPAPPAVAPTAAKPDEAAPAAPAQATQAGATGETHSDIELDAKPAGDSLPSANTAGGICEIDPSACAKQSDLQSLSNRDIRSRDIYTVQQVFFLRRGRFELNPYWSLSLNDQYVSHPGPGLALNYYLTNVLAVGVNGTFYQPFNGDSDFNYQNRRATRLAVPLNEYQAGGTVNFTYVPMYGKFQGFNDFIFHYDGYVIGGVGALRTRPIAVIDPDNRKFDYDWRAAFSVGLGLRIALNRWFAVTAELRDYIYIEQLENTTVAAAQSGPNSQQDSSTWFGEKPLTNNVQAQIGISMFLPTSWEYRLPK